jgi:hypothetical protein
VIAASLVGPQDRQLIRGAECEDRLPWMDTLVLSGADLADQLRDIRRVLEIAEQCDVDRPRRELRQRVSRALGGVHRVPVGVELCSEEISRVRVGSSDEECVQHIGLRWSVSPGPWWRSTPSTPEGDRRSACARRTVQGGQPTTQRRPSIDRPDRAEHVGETRERLPGS